MPLSTLKRNLDELEGKKFIVRSKRFRRSGGVAGCTYTLNVKATFEMPGNERSSYDFVAEDEAGTDAEQEEVTLAQNELARSPTSELARSPTGGLAIEVLNSEVLNSEVPLHSANAEGVSPTQIGLFGAVQAELPDRTRPPLHQQVETLWHELKRDHPVIADVRKIDDGMRHTIELRAKQHAKEGQAPIDVWKEFFETVRRSRFLTGQAPPGRDREDPFKLSLPWALKAANFRKIIGGQYDGTSDTRLVDADTGRRLGPTEQALRGSIAGFRAARERQRSGGNQGGYLPGPEAAHR